MNRQLNQLKLKLGLLIFYFAISLIGGSCSNVQTINMTSHEFGLRPKTVVWIQIPGLTDEHWAFIKFNRYRSKRQSGFEHSLCLGKMWNYNLFKIRPKAYEGLMAQITGRPNIKNSCQDFSMAPLWHFYHKVGHQTGILEYGVKDRDSLDRSFSCFEKAKKGGVKTAELKKGSSRFVKDLILWRMAKANKKNIRKFHYQEKIPFKPGVYFDKSCQSETCYVGLFRNTVSLFNGLKASFEVRDIERRSNKTLFIIRNFALLSAIKSKNISKIKEELLELEKLFNYFFRLSKKEGVLLVVSSSESINIEFPFKGRQWRDFVEKGKHLIYKKSSLLSSVYASGAGAEHFCGVYSEYEIFKRFIMAVASGRFNFSRVTSEEK